MIYLGRGMRYWIFLWGCYLYCIVGKLICLMNIYNFYFNRIIVNVKVGSRLILVCDSII